MTYHEPPRDPARTVAQYWVNNNLWLGGGAGVAALVDSNSDPITGLGVDLRAGYTFSASTFNVSAELTPSFYTVSGSSSVTITGIAILFGNQHL